MRKYRSLVLTLILLIIVAIAGYLWHEQGTHNSLNYWQEWASGKVKGKTDEARLFNDFDRFFKKGPLTAEQSAILPTAHFVHQTGSIKQYQWNDNSHKPVDAEEGSRIFTVIVDHQTGMITEADWGVILD